MKKLLNLCLFSLCICSINAQSGSGLSLIGGVHNGKVILRWAPQDVANWQKGIAQGYRLERVTIREGAQNLTTQQSSLTRVSLAARLQVQSEDQLLLMADTSQAAGVAAAAIYQDSFNVENMGNDPFSRMVNANAQLESRFGFSLFAAEESIGIAQALALGWVDTTVISGNAYRYYLNFWQTIGDTTQLGIGTSLTLDMNIPLELPTPAAPQVSAGDQQLVLSWDTRAQEQHYSSYRILRSSDNGTTWTIRNNAAILGAENNAAPASLSYFADSVAQNNQNYLYRLQGRSALGIWGPASASMAGVGKDPKKAINPSVSGVTEETPGQLKVQWTLPESNEALVQGFQVLRSRTVQGPYLPISADTLASSTRDFIDSQAPSSAYYMVQAIDQQGEVFESLPQLGQISDTTPPAAPTGLQGKADAYGRVNFSWTANTEADLQGYRILTSNYPNGAFIEISANPSLLNKYEYQVDLSTGAKAIYFKVQASDHHENTSEPSAVLAVALPDVSPPAIPLLIRADPTKLGVRVEWNPSESEDIAKHVVQRKALAEAKWEDLQTLEGALNGPQSLEDTTLAGYSDWEYRIMAFDSTGLFSNSKVLKVRPLTVKRAAVSIQKIETALVDNVPALKLLWTYPADPNVHDFLIYRSKGENDFIAFKTINLNQTPPLSTDAAGNAIYTWKDTDIDRGVRYRYRIIARYLNGDTSPWSSIIEKSL